MGSWPVFEAARRSRRRPGRIRRAPCQPAPRAPAANTTEEILVDELAQSFWRMRRFRKLEVHSWSLEHLNASIDNGMMTLVARSLASAERSFHKALTALQKLQEHTGHQPALPIKRSASADLGAGRESVVRDREKVRGFVPQKPVQEQTTANLPDTAKTLPKVAETRCSRRAVSSREGMRSILLIASLACWSSLLLPGQQTAEGQPAAKKQSPPGILHSISVRGNQLYSAADIIQESGLKPGQHINRAGLDQARQRIQDTELFNNVAYEYRTSGGEIPAYDVTFQVAENDQIFPTRFERFGVSADALRSCLRTHVKLYSDRIPGTEGVLHRYADAVGQCVGQSGPAVKVRAAISNEDPQQLTVMFTPDTPAPTISQVIVSGNQAVDTGTILRAVNSVAIGSPLSDTRLKMILDGAIRPLYAAKGYAAVSFPKVETEPAKTNLGVIVKVEIRDGPVFKFGSIRFHGSGLDEDEIRSTIPFKSGQAFNSEQVDNFRLDLLRKMRRKGLLDASITTEAEPDDSKRAVNVTYNVTPGAIYNFQTLDIQGLDVTSEPVVARLWGEKQGHPFNPDYPDFFLKRVQQQGLFDNLADARSDYSADASTHNVTVHLYFKGGESAKEHERKKKEEEERRQTDGSWSPW